MKKETKKPLGLVVGAVAAVLLIAAGVMVTGAGRKSGPLEASPVPVETPQPTQEAPAVTEEPVKEKWDMHMTEEGEICIRTEFITLNYPADYATDVMIDLAEDENGYRIGVSSAINGKDLELYALTLSKAESDGFRLGMLKNDAIGEVGVYMIMNEQSADAWTADEFERINVLQETVNSLLMQVYETEYFIAE